MINQVKNIKDLNVTLDKLYNNDYQLNLHLSDKPFIFTIVLKDVRKNVDCKISSFGANLWSRTKAGLNYKKYSRIQDLQTQLKKLIHNKVETNGRITFSLTKEICLI